MQQLNGKMRTIGAADSMKKRKNLIKILFPALTWVCGLLLAGSDGPWMPYINGAGGLMFFGGSIWLGRVLPGLENTGKIPDVSPRARSLKTKTVSRPAQPGYARELGLV